MSSNRTDTSSVTADPPAPSSPLRPGPKTLNYLSNFLDQTIPAPPYDLDAKSENTQEEEEEEDDYAPPLPRLRPLTNEQREIRDACRSVAGRVGMHLDLFWQYPEDEYEDQLAPPRKRTLDATTNTQGRHKRPFVGAKPAHLTPARSALSAATQPLSDAEALQFEDTIPDLKVLDGTRTRRDDSAAPPVNSEEQGSLVPSRARPFSVRSGAFRNTHVEQNHQQWLEGAIRFGMTPSCQGAFDWCFSEIRLCPDGLARTLTAQDLTQNIRYSGHFYMWVGAQFQFQRMQTGENIAHKTKAMITTVARRLDLARMFFDTLSRRSFD